MTSESNESQRNTIPFDEIKVMDDTHPLAESEAQIAINMVLDMKADRAKQQGMWRVFAGVVACVLVVIAILTALNYHARYQQVSAFEMLMTTSPMAVNEALAKENKALADARLEEVARSMFFYHQCKFDFEREVQLAMNDGIPLTPHQVNKIKAFNDRAKLSGWALVKLPE